MIEALIYMILKGLAIGVLVSAPMGPVGILCIQRALNKGRWAGFFTGIGAAISDLFYCLLTGFGLSFVEDFIEQNQTIIQLVGSVVLITFGVYLFKKNPTTQLQKQDVAMSNLKKYILTGFLFTVSNPLILFLIIGLFAQFGFMSLEFKFYHYIAGFLFIFAGAVLWWYVVTFFVDKVRSHFNLRSMWLINKVIASIIFVFAVIAIFNALSDYIAL